MERRGPAPQECSLTNLDQPLGSDAGATKPIWWTIPTPSATASSRSRRRPLSVLRATRGVTVMRGDVPEVHPGLGATPDLGGGVEAGGLSTPCATIGGRCSGQPTTGDRIPPHLAGGRYSTASDASLLDLDPPTDDGVLRRGGRRVLRAPGSCRCRPGRGSHDQRPQGRARLRTRRRRAPIGDMAAVTRAIAPRAARSIRPRDDGVPDGVPRRQGVRRLHPHPAPHRRRRLQPSSCPGGAGVVSSGLVRFRRALRPADSTVAHGAQRPRRARSVGRGWMPAPARRLAERPHRAWPAPHCRRPA